MSRLLVWLSRVAAATGRNAVEGLKMYGALSAGVYRVPECPRRPHQEWLPDDPERPGRHVR